jgi:hypothetical protein
MPESLNHSTLEPPRDSGPVVPGSKLYRLLKLVAEAVARRCANDGKTFHRDTSTSSVALDDRPPKRETGRR